MSTLQELNAHHQTALADYATALNAFRDAYVNLAALERTLANNNVGGTRHSTFGPRPDVISLRHPIAAPNTADDWPERITAATNARIAAFPTPDPEE